MVQRVSRENPDNLTIMKSIRCRDQKESKDFQELKVFRVSLVLQAVETTTVSLDTREIQERPVPKERKETRASWELKVVLENVGAVPVLATRALLDLLDLLVSQALRADPDPKDFGGSQEGKGTRVREDRKAFRGFSA